MKKRILGAAVISIAAYIVLLGTAIGIRKTVARYDLPDPMNVKYYARYDLPDPMSHIIRF